MMRCLVTFLLSVFSILTKFIFPPRLAQFVIPTRIGAGSAALYIPVALAQKPDALEL
jgi:hypothetical protein